MLFCTAQAEHSLFPSFSLIEIVLRLWLLLFFQATVKECAEIVTGRSQQPRVCTIDRCSTVQLSNGHTVDANEKVLFALPPQVLSNDALLDEQHGIL